jgi:hypothetical protein
MKIEFSKCSGCNESINDLYYLTVGDRFHWHESCLKCSQCWCSLQAQSKCYLYKEKFYCFKDYLTIKKDQATTTSSSLMIIKDNKENYSNCRSCKQVITFNDYIIRLQDDINNNNKNNKFIFHLRCFCCFVCSRLLEPGNPYAIINENIYCQQHYYREKESLNLNGKYIFYF